MKRIFKIEMRLGITGTLYDVFQKIDNKWAFKGFFISRKKAEAFIKEYQSILETYEV